MKDISMFTNILIAHNILVAENDVILENTKYYNAYLLSNFGIELDKPELASAKMMEQLSKRYELEIPKSFYNNPQDIKKFTVEELALERLISYFAVETVGYCNRIELFKKELNNYVIGKEITVRKFKVLTEEEVIDFLIDYAKNLSAYTRPYGIEDLIDMTNLIANGFIKVQKFGSVSNMMELATKFPEFAKYLTERDVVKYSIKYLGEYKNFLSIYGYGDTALFDDKIALIKNIIPLLNRDPNLSKKQAKYFNKLVKVCKLNEPKATNKKSIYRLAKIALKTNGPVAAAKLLNKNGSLLIRHLIFLLSRSTQDEMQEILNLVPSTNPIILIQLLNSLTTEDKLRDNRIFTFYTNNLLKHHTETDEETAKRKSKLSINNIIFLRKCIIDKLTKYYDTSEKLGKIFVSHLFDKITVPLNTSASGKGIDIFPAGSRIPLEASKIRLFTYWKDIYDVDATLALVGDDFFKKVNFNNYNYYKDLLQFSGDNRSNKGSEFYDLDLDLLRENKINQVIFVNYSYVGDFTEGRVVCGYQNKVNFNTKAWDPKNIAFQTTISGNTTMIAVFAVDLVTNEIIVLNQAIKSESNIFERHDFESCIKFMGTEMLEFSMADVLKHRGELVDTPEEADIIFSNSDIQTEKPIVRATDIEKLVAITNCVKL